MKGARQGGSVTLKPKNCLQILPSANAYQPLIEDNSYYTPALWAHMHGHSMFMLSTR